MNVASKLDVLQKTVAIIAIFCAGIWALYTYQFSDEARHMAQLRELEFQIVPSAEMTIAFLPDNLNSRRRVKIEVEVINRDVEQFELVPYMNRETELSIAKVTGTSNQNELTNVTYLMEGIVNAGSLLTGSNESPRDPDHVEPQLEDIFSVDPGEARIILSSPVVPPGRTAKLKYLSAPLLTGYYQVDFLGLYPNLATIFRAESA